MYRKLQTDVIFQQIYCPHEWCDQDCGKFHHQNRSKKQFSVKAFVNAIEEAAGVSATHTILSNENCNGRPHLRISTSQDTNTNNEKSNDLKTPINSPAISQTSSGQTLTVEAPNMSSTNPTTPSPSSQSSVAQTLTSSVTLEDIIASARRKISEDFMEIRIPSPVFMEDDEIAGLPSGLRNRSASKRAILALGSSLDLPGFIDAVAGDDDDEEKYSGLDYEDSEAELIIQGEPPSFIAVGDEDREDFEELLKATKAQDVYANPILRDGDPLTARRKRMQKRQTLLQLAAVNSGEIAIRKTSSTANLEDDLSSADVSNMGSRQSPNRQIPSPANENLMTSNIIQFIEEQKKKAEQNGTD